MKTLQPAASCRVSIQTGRTSRVPVDFFQSAEHDPPCKINDVCRGTAHPRRPPLESFECNFYRAKRAKPPDSSKVGGLLLILPPVRGASLWKTVTALPPLRQASHLPCLFLLPYLNAMNATPSTYTPRRLALSDLFIVDLRPLRTGQIPKSWDSATRVRAVSGSSRPTPAKFSSPNSA